MAEDSAPNLQNALRQRGGIQRPTRGTAKARPTKKEGKGIGNVMAGLNWFASMADQAIVNALWADSKPSQRPQKPRKRSRERLNKVQGNDNTSLKGSDTDATRLAGQLPSASEGESHRLPRRPGPAVSLPDASGGQARQAFGSLQAKGPGQQAVANPAPKRAGTPVNAPRMSLPEKGPQPSNKPQIPSLEIAPRSVSVESLPRSVSVDSSHGLELEPAPRGVSLDSVSNELQDVSQDSHRSGTLARHTGRTHASRVPSRDSVARRHALVERASSVDSQSGRPISLKPAPRPARDVRSIVVPAGGDDCDDVEDIEGYDACDHLETMQGEACHDAPTQQRNENDPASCVPEAASAHAKIEGDGPEVEAETTASVERRKDMQGHDACDHLETMQGETFCDAPPQPRDESDPTSSVPEAASANAKIEDEGPEVEAETTASVQRKKDVEGNNTCDHLETMQGETLGDAPPQQRDENDTTSCVPEAASANVEIEEDGPEVVAERTASVERKKDTEGNNTCDHLETMQGEKFGDAPPQQRDENDSTSCVPEAASANVEIEEDGPEVIAETTASVERKKDVEGDDVCDHLETMQGETFCDAPPQQRDENDPTSCVPEAASANAKIEDDGPEVVAETTASVERKKDMEGHDACDHLETMPGETLCDAPPPQIDEKDPTSCVPESASANAKIEDEGPEVEVETTASAE